MIAISCTVAAVLVLGSAALVLWLPPGRIPPYRGPRGRLLSGSVAEWTDVRVGGIDQWLAIWGRDRNLPARRGQDRVPANPAGHSWGALLGLLAAARYPEDYEAYRWALSAAEQWRTAVRSPSSQGGYL